jgi:hypothetical protein
MDKLEHYLDQVCRSIGGPRSLRQHIRQELGEHLRDAAAGHRAAGLSEEEALDRAIADFGGPEQVRSELEATHGHRLLAVVIEKAMQWKERTMKAKWLWTTWAYLAVIGLVVLELFFSWFTTIFVLPKMEKLKRDGVFHFDDQTWPVVSKAFSFLNALRWTWETLAGWLILLLVLLWGLFEWRVRSENKPFMRLAALGTIALVLLGVTVFTAASIEISTAVGLPGFVRQSTMETRIADIDTAITALELAAAKKDWDTSQVEVKRASEVLEALGPQVASLSRREEPKSEELRAQMKTANESLREGLQAIEKNDAERLHSAIERFQKSFGRVREMIKRPPG